MIAEYKPGAFPNVAGIFFFIDNIRPMGGAKKVGWAHLLVAGHRAIWGGRGARRHRQGALAGVEASSGRWMDGHFIKHIFVFNKESRVPLVIAICSIMAC